MGIQEAALGCSEAKAVDAVDLTAALALARPATLSLPYSRKINGGGAQAWEQRGGDCWAGAGGVPS
jgi:hypothetical protein